jgi:hypothetical protein
VFGEENVYLLSVSPVFDETRISTFIVLTSNSEIDIRDFESHMRNRMGGETASALVPGQMVDGFVKKRQAVLLTDDHAPVDNLIAPVFEERFGYNRKN